MGCFEERKVVLFQILLDGAEPRVLLWKTNKKLRTQYRLSVVTNFHDILYIALFIAPCVKSVYRLCINLQMSPHEGINCVKIVIFGPLFFQCRYN